MHCCACEIACPNDSIIAYETVVEINLEKCDECSSCVIICPVGALEVE